jgi:hypothetical protein
MAVNSPRASSLKLTLSLLVARIGFADDVYVALSSDHLAYRTFLLD